MPAILPVLRVASKPCNPASEFLEEYMGLNLHDFGLHQYKLQSAAGMEQAHHPHLWFCRQPLVKRQQLRPHACPLAEFMS